MPGLRYGKETSEKDSNSGGFVWVCFEISEDGLVLRFWYRLLLNLSLSFGYNLADQPSFTA